MESRQTCNCNLAKKNDIKHNKYYQWPECLLGGFVDTKPSITKWLVPKYKADIFQEDVKTDLTNLGGIQQAEKELEKNSLKLKALVKKIGDLSKILFKQKKTFFVNNINHTFHTELNKILIYQHRQSVVLKQQI